jgi:hypothetical protein
VEQNVSSTAVTRCLMLCIVSLAEQLGVLRKQTLTPESVTNKCLSPKQVFLSLDLKGREFNRITD